jgi:pyruvate kinase
MAPDGRLTRLVCTIGPASIGRIDELVASGMDVARLNFSHGTDDERRAAVAGIRRAAAAAGRTVAILADLPGPKVRLGALDGGERRMALGETLILGPGSGAISTSHAALAGDLAPGDRLLVADGAVELRVTAIDGERVVTETVRAGTARSGAGVNVPSERLSLPAIGERDRHALQLAGELDVDVIGQSFVRRAEDITALRALMGTRQRPIMAKIETTAAVHDIGRILETCDAVMVARGDLGVEIAAAEVPFIQKAVIASAVAVARPVTVATQMLESMIHAPRPTRAEASDVANAVLDGADAVLLSAETAIGSFPVEAATAAAEICRVADQRATKLPHAAMLRSSGDPAVALALGASRLTHSDDLHVAGIACFTRSGLTARLLSAARPDLVVHAFTPDETVARSLALVRGLVSHRLAVPAHTDEMLARLDSGLREAGMPVGSLVLLAAAHPFGEAHTNLIKLHRL